MVKGIREWIGRRIEEDRLHSTRAEDVSLLCELDGGVGARNSAVGAPRRDSLARLLARSLVRQVVKHMGGPAGYGTNIRSFARFHLLLSLVLFIVMTVWKYSYENNFYVSDELVLLNLSMGGVQMVLYLVIGASFCHHLVKAIRKNRSMDREVNPRRRLVIIMAALDLIAGLVTIAAFIASNAVSIANEGCGYFLGVNKVRPIGPMMMVMKKGQNEGWAQEKRKQPRFLPASSPSRRPSRLT